MRRGDGTDRAVAGARAGQGGGAAVQIALIVAVVVVVVAVLLTVGNLDALGAWLGGN